MGKIQSRWYRLADRRRTEKAEMLRSKSGRFHRDPIEEPTTYLADSIETAWSEMRAYFGEHANPKAFRLWEVTFPDAVLEREVDLTEEAMQQAQRTSVEELKAIPAPESLVALARKLRSEGSAGVVYWSVRNEPDGVCSAVFLEEASKTNLRYAVWTKSGSVSSRIFRDQTSAQPSSHTA